LKALGQAIVALAYADYGLDDAADLVAVGIGDPFAVGIALDGEAGGTERSRHT